MPLDNIRDNNYCRYVAGRLQAEIRQTKPFELIEEEAVLNIARTAEVLRQNMAEFLQTWQLSGTQYNVLRILRGAGDGGATCSQVSARMINHDPDITRLFDRLETRGLVARERGKEDRRIVFTRITPEGLSLLAQIDKPLRNHFRGRMEHMKPASLENLIGQLEQIRELFTNDRKDERK